MLSGMHCSFKVITRCCVDPRQSEVRRVMDDVRCDAVIVVFVSHCSTLPMLYVVLYVYVVTGYTTYIFAVLS